MKDSRVIDYKDPGKCTIEDELTRFIRVQAQKVGSASKQLFLTNLTVFYYEKQ